ncbi:hypothetical protein L1049_009361 [Liquidambar formosana]|uniref:Lysosomal Pro-X carboxypeptidase n=1 Tax=Liquidambar formosana TaxID=63359 RepID=A0AAP0X8W1_LIQFO
MRQLHDGSRGILSNLSTKVLINDTFWGGGEKNTPIFVYTGNEGDIEWFAQNTGFMFETAPHFQALLGFIESFYYKDIAYSNASTLGYLSSTQSLADYATLIIDLKKNLTATDSPVVVLGVSYGGMLAAWFRLKYPHVTIGALASSSPILNFENIASPYSFNDIVTQDYRSESENCYQVIKGSWQQIGEAASEVLQKSFRICDNYFDKGWLDTAYTCAAMTDYPTPSNFMSPLPAYPVKQVHVYTNLYGAATIHYNHTGNATCFYLADDSDPHGLRESTWQVCTEMIMLDGTDGITCIRQYPCFLRIVAGVYRDDNEGVLMRRAYFQLLSGTTVAKNLTTEIALALSLDPIGLQQSLMAMILRGF